MAVKLLVVVNDYPYFVAHRLHVVAAAAAAGWSIEVLGPAGVDVPDILRAQGWTLSQAPLVRARLSPLSDLRFAAAVAARVTRSRPDVVHAITIKPVLLGGLAMRFLGARAPSFVAMVPGLGTVFAAGASGLAARLRRALVERLYRTVTGLNRAWFVFETSADRAFFVERLGLTPDRALVVRGTGVDLDIFAPSQESRQAGGPFRLLFASRLLWSKGVRTICEAAALDRGDTGLAYAIAGWRDPGNPDSLSEAEEASLATTPGIDFLGKRADMPAVLAGVDAVVLPTTYPEGIPRILIEGAACGLPLIATDFPGAREVIVPDETGLILPDSRPETLAAAAARLAGDRALARRMGEAGRRLVVERGFASAAVQQTFLDVFARAARWTGR